MTQNRPGSFMSYLPGAVKDALLLLVTLGMVVVVLLQVEQNNKVSSRQHDSCSTRRELARQGNRSGKERKALEEALMTFVKETRRARADKHSTSYDMHFVKVIDSEVTPKLESIDPIFVPIPPPC
jgi:hypothetical protein